MPKTKTKSKAKPQTVLQKRLKLAKSPTLKQYDFAIAYCGEANGNGTEAARIARYAGNDVTLAAVAYDNLRNTQVVALIHRIRKNTERRARTSVMSAHEVKVRLSQIADGSLADVRNEKGEFDLDDAVRRGTDYLLKKIVERRTIIHRPRYSRRKAGAHAEYVQPKHDFRLTPEGKYLCVGCEEITEAREAMEKIASGEACTMKSDENVERVEYSTVEYTIEDRIKALEALAKTYKLFGDREELNPAEELEKIFTAAGIPKRLHAGAIEMLRNNQGVYEANEVSDKEQ